MKFYIAGKWQDRGNAKYVMQQIESMGHQVTCDWTHHDFDKGGVVASTIKLSNIAMEDFAGVNECEVYVAILVNPYEYKGLWVEMGLAMAWEKVIWTVGHYGDSCIFMNHPTISHKFDDIAELLNYIKEETPNV